MRNVIKRELAMIKFRYLGFEGLRLFYGEWFKVLLGIWFSVRATHKKGPQGALK